MAEPATTTSEPGALPVSFDTHPTRYRHWLLTVDGAVATLSLDVNEEAGIRPGYRLKLNSYDLGVDIELYDALQRILIDDRSSAVSLPEVPLLGVLPGTGGLTRLTDKRHVRRDLADVFCTTVEGVRGQRAHDWGLVDASVKPQSFDSYV